MDRSRRGFVTGGCWCVDRNKTIPFWPSEDMSILVSAPVLRGGGSACNFGIDIRKLDPDMSVETIGLVGDDAEGRFLLGEAKRYGIECSRLQVTAAAPTHATDAFQSLASGRRTHIFHDGASGVLSPDHFDFTGTRGRIVHLGLPGVHATMDAAWEGDANGWVAVLRKARAAGLATNLELVTVARDKLAALALPCLPHLDTLIVNDFEIGALTDLPTVVDGATDGAACAQAARRVLERGAMDVVVVHYVRGAVLCARDGTFIEKPSVRVPEAEFRGANGAGDAFAAGFLYARHQDWTYDRALTLAHATAAACLRSITTVDSVESVAECLRLAETWGWR
jgi:sugar/nucleoside kinase (ribokinase family)